MSVTLEEDNAPAESESETTTETNNPAIETKVKRFCNECLGPARGRGFSHTTACSKNRANAPKKEVVTCPECHSPRRGRGFMHKLDCSQRKNKQATITVAVKSNAVAANDQQAENAE